MLRTYLYTLYLFRKSSGRILKVMYDNLNTILIVPELAEYFIIAYVILKHIFFFQLNNRKKKKSIFHQELHSTYVVPLHLKKKP